MDKRIPLALAFAVLVAGCTSMHEADNKGKSRFMDVTDVAGIATNGARGAGWGDYDNDGCVDLMISGGKGPRLYRNGCDGTFVDVSKAAGISGPVGGFMVAWADYDNDGDLDWFIVNSKKNSVLLENRGTNGHFLRVKLKGIGNRDGIGARVEITADGKTQVKTIQAGKGYASSEELIAHFGLGQSSKVETLEVYWPNGARTQLSGLIADRQITVTQN